jgi:TonB-dependent SusC/RagA subfamily outer membrane receptor
MTNTAPASIHSETQTAFIAGPLGFIIHPPKTWLNLQAMKKIIVFVLKAYYLMLVAQYYLLKPFQMKKLVLLTLSISFYSLSLSAQIDKKDPLIVINGNTSNVELNSIDPKTIEAVTVLKDQAALDAYGEIGKNGVILVTTKDDIKPDAPKDKISEALILVNGEIYTSRLDSIDPKEIKTVTVLKDKSATDIYGKAGEKGVILITTNDNIKLKK